MFGSIHGILVFLITEIFDIFNYILIFRVLLAASGSYSAEPLVQVVVKATSFITTPVRKFIPDYKNIEVGTIVLIFVLSLIKNLLRIIISFGVPNILNLIIGSIIMAIGDALNLLVWVIFFLILIKAILSWIQPGARNPMLDRIVEPVLRPARKIIPPVSGIDFSAILPLIILQLISFFVLNPIIAKGYNIALG